MRIISYNQELAISSLLFSKLFRNITINRELPNNTVEKCKVALVMGNRSRILKAFENAQENPQFTLPMISITRTGLNRDSTRLSNLHNEVKHSTDEIINYDLYTPNPINIDYKVTIYTKYISDLDMILSNFMIFFNSDIYVSSIHPKYTDLRYNSQIVMGDSINESRNEALSNTNLDLITAEISFVFKTYLFGGNQRVSSKPYSYERPITSITEITCIDHETGEPIIDEETGEISVITTQVTGVKDEIFEGFIPLINSLYIELHAVPKHDIFRIKDGTRINYDWKQYVMDYENKNPNENDGRMFDNPDVEVITSLDWIIDNTLTDFDFGDGDEDNE